ncbi:MAG: hypothetical protein QGH73_18720 [Rhodospirillales bacterium]|jgi:hypothetical protein|nr:hypothetical protein [Rhodospirillaceae bacterium]MDP6429443.1 hypothetical protein [Rhodospirillales bacterium]MDP6644110.1 hypothetical protein [Rhodospirillales bacterium]MDP6843708.1 hypothetical protein [Rhodospirillales bacterium]|tara:strand:+ start:224 stop:568 length:345 start_codon:yes stop_codon:yes gene_type:complete
MNENRDDYRDLLVQKRFLAEVEQGIRLANRELIHKRIPELNKDKILSFAIAVGRLRARYLAAAVNMSVNEAGESPDKDYIEDLRQKRQAYEEARVGFDALRDAMEKGYIDVEEL